MVAVVRVFAGTEWSVGYGSGVLRGSGGTRGEVGAGGERLAQ